MLQFISLHNTNTNRTFKRWKEEQQKEFLDFCCGARGVKVLYDSFFKEVFNPEYSPEPLNQLLSTLLDMKVHILKVLPPDTTRMGDETSLVEMDIVVETEDGTIINIELLQRYTFICLDIFKNVMHNIDNKLDA